jgi:lipid-A-disaccharide synthase
MLQVAGEDDGFCAIHVRSSHELMQRAAVGMVCSGTATLEAAFFGLPLVVIYKVAWLTWTIGKRLVKVPFLGMPNVLAEREIAREFLQSDAQPELIAQELLRLLSDHPAREGLQRELEKVTGQLGDRGAAERAATAVCELLGIGSAR